MSKKTLLFLDPESKGYQAERLRQLAQRFSEEQDLVCLVSSEIDNPHKGHFCRLGRVRKAGEGRFIFFWKTFFTPIFLFYQILAWRPTLVVSDKSGFCPLVFLAAFFVGAQRVLLLPAKPWLISQTNSFLEELWLKQANKLSLWFSTKIIVPSKAMKIDISKQFSSAAKKLEVLSFSPEMLRENPAEDSKSWKKWLSAREKLRTSLCERLEIPERSLIMVSCSPLDSEHSLEVVVRAISTTNKKIYLIICAEGPNRNKILSLIVGLGITEQIVLVGEIEKRFEFIEACDVLLLPRPGEGLSDSLLDALASGTAVLAGRGEESAEILGEGSFLFEDDHVGNLAQTFEEMASKKTMLEEGMKSSLGALARLPSNWSESVYDLISD